MGGSTSVTTKSYARFKIQAPLMETGQCRIRHLATPPAGQGCMGSRILRIRNPRAKSALNLGPIERSGHFAMVRPEESARDLVV